MIWTIVRDLEAAGWQRSADGATLRSPLGDACRVYDDRDLQRAALLAARDERDGRCWDHVAAAPPRTPRPRAAPRPA